MATVQILQCNGCGANLSPANTTCEYCGSVNIIKSEVNPFKLDANLSRQYTQYFKDKASQDPKDTNALYSLGLFYLGLKNYDLALRNFKEAIDQSPDNPDIYYHYAMTLTAGRKPRKLMINDIKKIEEYVKTAMQMESQAKYCYMLAMVKNDFYPANGMKMSEPGPGALIAEGETLPQSPEDIDLILEHIVIKDEDIIARIKKQ